MKIATPPTDEQMTAAKMRWFGESRADIARKVGVSESTVQSWMRSAWWPEAMQEASRLGHDKMVSQARKVLHNIMQAATLPDAPTPIVKEAAATARWYLERKDPDMRTNQSSSEEARAMDKLVRMLDNLSPSELAALAQEPVVLGFPTEETEEHVKQTSRSGTLSGKAQEST